MPVRAASGSPLLSLRKRLTFGMLPHDLGWWVAIYRAVEHTSFAVDAILVVGLHHKSRGHCGKGGGEKRGLASPGSPKSGDLFQ